MSHHHSTEETVKAGLTRHPITPLSSEQSVLEAKLNTFSVVRAGAAYNCNLPGMTPGLFPAVSSQSALAGSSFITCSLLVCSW